MTACMRSAGQQNKAASNITLVQDAWTYTYSMPVELLKVVDQWCQLAEAVKETCTLIAGLASPATIVDCACMNMHGSQQQHVLIVGRRLLRAAGLPELEVASLAPWDLSHPAHWP